MATTTMTSMNQKMLRVLTGAALLALVAVSVAQSAPAAPAKSATVAVPTTYNVPAVRPPSPWHPPLVPTSVLPPSSVLRGHSRQVAVLMYHRVGPLPPHAEQEEKSLTVSATRFELDLRELRAAGCHCLTMAQASTLLSRGELPRHAVVLTFDDGYDDNYTVAWPLMRKYGYVGTFNIVYDSLSAPGHMNREQVKELAAAGNELGSHTVSHAVLTRLDEAHLKMEVTEPRQKLQSLIGSPIVTFCYPEGRHNSRVVNSVRQAGYRVAMTVERGSWTPDTPPLEIPRFRMAEQVDLQKCLGSWLSPRRIRATH